MYVCVHLLFLWVVHRHLSCHPPLTVSYCCTTTHLHTYNNYNHLSGLSINEQHTFCGIFQLFVLSRTTPPTRLFYLLSHAMLSVLDVVAGSKLLAAGHFQLTNCMKFFNIDYFRYLSAPLSLVRILSATVVVE